MIRCFASNNGTCALIKKGDLPKIKGKKSFACLLLEHPTEEEIDKVCKEFKFQKKYFLNYTKEARSMRYSMRPLVFVFIDYYIEDDEMKVTHTLFDLKKNVLTVTIPQRSKYHSELFTSITQKLKEEGKENSPAYFLYHFLHEDARENYDVLDVLDDKIMAVEDEVTKQDISPHMVSEIVTLKRKCFRMSKQLWASAKLIYTIKRGLTPLTLDKELLMLMDDVYDTLIHQIDLLAVQREILTDLLEIYATTINNKLAIISNDLNIIMKKLTAMTVIIMVPTFIASFYGMNFKYMPELESPYGYIIAATMMISLALVLYLYFHLKKKWI
ncbi:hypothetical protein FJZ53_04620 [Candidatus Woesearchaeota archaeon]|nr:hypothetical protein [Candidatus Woesearchaeota archaeon]